MKKCLKTLSLIIGCSILFSVSAFAAAGDYGEAVYASRSDQDALIEIIEKSEDLMKQLNYDGVSILKESITPVFVADFLEYAETGVFRIWPDSLPHVENDPASFNGSVYMSKAVTADGLFAGYMMFHIDDGVASSLMFTPTPVLEHYFDARYGFGGNANLVSRSYADHAGRIQALMESDSLIPASQVRYVGIQNLGEAFYINDGNIEALVVISASGNVFTSEIMYFGDDLKKKADECLVEFNEQEKAVQEWMEANPGEFPLGSLDGMSSPYYSVDKANVDDIIDIAAYLGDAIDISPDSTSLIPSEDNSEDGFGLGIALGIAAAAVLLTGAGFMIYLKLK
jgi:hypothetical protein